MKALLALEDGRTFPCSSFTGAGEARGEVVFNTSMSGYQEVLTDPSYKGQLVTMTYPLIGNYGVNPDDIESDRIQVAGFLVKEYQEFPNNYRATATLGEYLQQAGVLGVENLDTRALTRHIRNSGALRAYISTDHLDPDYCISQARAVAPMTGLNLAVEVSTATPYRWVDDKPVPLQRDLSQLDHRIWRHRGSRPGVVAFDFGIKYNLLRRLTRSGGDVIVVPSFTTAGIVRAMAPQGVFLSNGPGDPEPVTDAIATIRELLGFRPMFGICLGHQLAALALGGRTYKLKFGHRGINQPVKNLLSGDVEITSHNHGFAVDIDSLDSRQIEITHINLNDNTLEGFRHKTLPIFTVQYHPEASPGPHDADYLFTQFVDLMARNA